MSKFIVLLLIVLLAFTCFALAQEAQTQEVTTDGAAEVLRAKKAAKKGKFASKKCLKWQKTSCEYVTACAKATNKCVKSKRQRRCLKYVKRTVVTKKAVCLRYKTVRANNKCGTKKRVCARSGFKKVRTTKAVCARFGVKTTCLKRKVVCAKRKLVKRCTLRTRKFKVRGPRKCRKGFKLTFARKGKVIKRTCVAIPRTPPKPEPTKTCFSYLDPHTTTFKGNYEFQHVGDYLFAETADRVFRVDYRLKSYGAWTGPIAVAIRVNGIDTLEYTVGNQGTWKLNGKPLALPNGQKVVMKNGGEVEAKYPNFAIKSPAGHSAVIVVQGGYTANLYVNIPQSKVAGVRGVCNNQKLLAKGLFGFTYKSKYFDTKVTHKKWTKAQLANARARCVAALGPKHKGFRLHACINDYLNATPAQRKQILRWEGRIDKQKKAEKKLLKIKVVKKVVDKRSGGKRRGGRRGGKRRGGRKGRRGGRRCPKGRRGRRCRKIRALLKRLRALRKCRTSKCRKLRRALLKSLRALRKGRRGGNRRFKRVKIVRRRGRRCPKGRRGRKCRKIRALLKRLRALRKCRTRRCRKLRRALLKSLRALRKGRRGGKRRGGRKGRRGGKVVVFKRAHAHRGRPAPRFYKRK